MAFGNIVKFIFLYPLPKEVYAHPTETFNFGLMAVGYQTPVSLCCRAKCEIRSVIRFVYVKTELIEVYSESSKTIVSDLLSLQHHRYRA